MIPARATRSAASAVLVAWAVALLGVAATPPAARAAVTACPANDVGVTVVVDFRSLGGDTIVACAPGDVSSGFDALRQAGIDFDVVTRFPSFLCRIEAVPASDPCQDTPPADAYWSYWHADRGGDWQYATRSADAYRPPPGSVEGWSFSTDANTAQGAPPRTSPPAPASAPSPSPSSSQSTSPSPSPAASPRPGPSSTPPGTPSTNPNPTSETSPAAIATSSPSTAPTTQPSADAAAPSPQPTPDTIADEGGVPATGSPPGSEVNAVDNQVLIPGPDSDAGLESGDRLRQPSVREAAAGGSSSSGPAGVILSITLVVGLGGAAAVGARRRR